MTTTTKRGLALTVIAVLLWLCWLGVHDPTPGLGQSSSAQLGDVLLMIGWLTTGVTGLVTIAAGLWASDRKP